MSDPESRSNVLRLRFPLDNRWERHYGGPDRSVTTRLHATIGPKHRILLNANLYRLIGSPEEVLLYFNRKVSKIAIESANPGTTGAFPVTARRGSYEIPAASFCRDNQIMIRTTQKFVVPQITHERRLFLDLKRTIPVTRRRNVCLGATEPALIAIMLESRATPKKPAVRPAAIPPTCVPCAQSPIKYCSLLGLQGRPEFSAVDVAINPGSPGTGFGDTFPVQVEKTVMLSKTE